MYFLIILKLLLILLSLTEFVHHNDYFSNYPKNFKTYKLKTYITRIFSDHTQHIYINKYINLHIYKYLTTKKHIPKLIFLLIQKNY